MSDVRELPVAEPASAALPEEQAIALAGAVSMPLSDCSAAEQAERRYLAVFNPLLAEAWQQGSMESFVDTLTWTLARVIAGLDKPYVTGDILRRIGNYTCRIADTNRAEAEAETAKKEGRLPN